MLVLRTDYARDRDLPGSGKRNRTISLIHSNDAVSIEHCCQPANHSGQHRIQRKRKPGRQFRPGSRRMQLRHNRSILNPWLRSMHHKDCMTRPNKRTRKLADHP